MNFLTVAEQRVDDRYSVNVYVDNNMWIKSQHILLVPITSTEVFVFRFIFPYLRVDNRHCPYYSAKTWFIGCFAFFQTI